MKSKIIGKKQLLIFTLVSAFSLAVFVNWYYTNKFDTSSKPELNENVNLGDAQLVNSNSVNNNTDDYFSTAKVRKSKAHSEAINHLEDIINNKNYDNETITLAKHELVNLSEIIKTETDVENIIKAQLKLDSIVIISADNIEILVPENILNDEIIKKLKNIVLSKTSLSSDKIIIMEVK